MYSLQSDHFINEVLAKLETILDAYATAVC